ncbi:toprim domain-containing protein [Bradyrhizobium sp. 31Argb]|uniref:toprim domain-containing protein n=1 Tax=Bradyrhizobium sp. 31Argb TaxID=3141247 RepID=UPI00374A2A5A
MSGLNPDHERAFDDWVDRARAVKIEDILGRHNITLKRKAGPCPVCGGRDRFSIDTGKQLFFCRRCGRGGRGAIDLMIFIDGCDFLAAVEALTGEPPPKRKRKETDDERRVREQYVQERRERLDRERCAREQREAAELRATLQYCDRLWAEVEPLPQAAVDCFKRRHISLDDVPDQGGLRFHPQFRFNGVAMPCIVARYTDVLTKTPGGIWYRPVTGEKPKSLGPTKHRVIRLWPDEYVTERLTIGEGIETTISAATNHHGTLLRPAWACGCANNMRNFPALPGVKSITIVADADANGVGQDAARTCANRWAAADREAEVLVPNKIGFDFNDLARGAS